MADLSAITLRNFRSYTEASFEFGEGVNIIIGPNAVGKTNLLEAVYLSCFGKGFRARSDSDLIKKGSDWARLDVTFSKNERIIKLDISSGRLKKQFSLNGTNKVRLSFDDILPSVLFQPDDLRLTTGGPQRRREYIDTLLAQTLPGFADDVRAYQRSLLQRNTLLKSNSSNSSISPNHMFVWDLQIAERGGRIAAARQNIISTINEVLSDTYSTVAGRTHKVDVLYETHLRGDNYSSVLMRALSTGLASDIRRGSTGYSPHRDDLGIMIDDQPMKDVASRGESRTLLLALKIIELSELSKIRGQAPLLLLDDVFSELDGSRRKLLTSHLSRYQTIITTTDADVVNKKFTHTANVLTL